MASNGHHFGRRREESRRARLIKFEISVELRPVKRFKQLTGSTTGWPESKGEAVRAPHTKTSLQLPRLGSHWHAMHCIVIFVVVDVCSHNRHGVQKGIMEGEKQRTTGKGRNWVFEKMKRNKENAKGRGNEKEGFLGGVYFVFLFINFFFISTCF